MTVTSTDGNVIHADFGKPEPSFALNFGLFDFRFDLLYCDPHIALARLTYTFPNGIIVRHVTSEP